MYQLKQNIKNIYGSSGETWISNLPIIVSALKTKWNLSGINPVDNMTFHYVAKAIANNSQPVVLKIGHDKKVTQPEIEALNYFNGEGSIKLLDYDATHNALLLQQAIPGTTLKSLFPNAMDTVIDCYADTIHKLHTKTLPNQHHYRHIRDWLNAIDKLPPSDECPAYLLEKAIQLKNDLLATATSEVFLHGDLHHDNILKNNDGWLAIDPKGVVGEPEFEIAAFDFMLETELSNPQDAQRLYTSRINQLAVKAQLNPNRIQSWGLVRLILMAAWQVEDQCDPSRALKLAKLLYT